MPFLTNPERGCAAISAWLSKTLRDTGRREYVLGLSGGLDSALAAYLAVKAVGAEHLLCLLLPYKTSSRESLADAQIVAQTLGVRSHVIQISDMAEAYEAQAGTLSPVRRGNLCARLRMTALFDSSHASGLVLGTSNKTETLLGYGTLYGDAACSVNPLGDLYKTDVRLLADYLNVPESIRRKIPTGDLWEGQTDEGELGFSYDELDKMLVKLIDKKKSRRELLEAGENPRLVERVVALIRGSAFKRKAAPIAWLAPPYSTAHIEDAAW
ncbi:MAG: NAD+ synthase [bacterium]|nr:NAD+ synthase [bacterium]